MPKPRDRRPPQPPPAPLEPREQRPSARRLAYVRGEIRRRLELLDLHERGFDKKAPGLSTGGFACSADEAEN